MRFPTIFALAMDILPIQGSSVPCERVFSDAKETTTPRRNRLSPEMMEALQMLKFSAKRGRELNFTSATSKLSEEEALDLAQTEQGSIPVDHESYRTMLMRLVEEDG
jgi:hypothetical protein